MLNFNIPSCEYLLVCQSVRMLLVTLLRLTNHTSKQLYEPGVSHVFDLGLKRPTSCHVAVSLH